MRGAIKHPPTRIAMIAGDFPLWRMVGWYIQATNNRQTHARTDACTQTGTHARTHLRTHACTHARAHVGRLVESLTTIIVLSQSNSPFPSEKKGDLYYLSISLKYMISPHFLREINLGVFELQMEQIAFGLTFFSSFHRQRPVYWGERSFRSAEKMRAYLFT